MSCIQIHVANDGSSTSNKRSIASWILDDTSSTRPWSTQCCAAYCANGDLMLFLSTWSLRWRRTLRDACARIECAEWGSTWKPERSSVDLDRRSDVKNSLTE